MRQYKNICTKENFEAEFQYLKLATLIYNKFIGWYDSFDQLCELQAEEGKYAIVGEKLTDAVVYEGTSSCWESTGVLFFQKFIDDFVSSEITLTDKQKRAICVLIGASYGSGEGSGSGSGSGGTIDIEKYLKEVGKYLKAGNYISITNNTISCLLEPGDGIAITNNKISCTDTKVFEIVNELPTSNIKDDKIYLLDEGNGKFSQYVYSGGGWNNITPKAEVVIPDGSGGDITKEQILQLLGFDRNNTTQYLRKDGQWVTPPDTNTTYTNATQSAAGLMSALDKKKLDTLQNVTAASLLGYGSDTTKYLRNDGVWATPPNTKYSVATENQAGLMSAEDKQKLNSLTPSEESSGDTYINNYFSSGFSFMPGKSYNPFTYVKLTLKGDLNRNEYLTMYSIDDWTSSYFAYNATKQTPAHETITPDYNTNGYSISGSFPKFSAKKKNDYLEFCYKTKDTAYLNGEDIYKYEDDYYEGYSEEGYQYPSKRYLRYLKVLKKSTSNSASISYSGDIITINSQPYLVTTSNFRWGTGGINLPILNGEPQEITYITGATLVQPKSSVARTYMTLNPNDTYDQRLKGDTTATVNSQEGLVIPTNDSATGKYTIYMVLEQIDTYETNLPKQLLFKGSYPNLNIAEGGWGTDTSGRIIGDYYDNITPILYMFSRDATDQNQRLYRSLLWGDRCEISIVNDEKVLVQYDSETTSYKLDTKSIYVPKSEVRDSNNYYIGNVKKSSGIKKVTFRIVYKIEIDKTWIPEGAFDGKSVFGVSKNNPISGIIPKGIVNITPLKDIIEE